MSLESGSNISSILEGIILAITFAGWAAMGLPYFTTIGACICLAILSYVLYRWMASRYWF
jgi:hypothetical protein